MYLVRTATASRSTPSAAAALSYVRELIDAGRTPVVSDISGKVLTQRELEQRLDGREAKRLLAATP